jgi:5'-methylthioadenosine phosphorylase
LRVAPDRDCSCRRALEFAILTDPEAIPAETRARLDPLVGRYLRRAT